MQFASVIDPTVRAPLRGAPSNRVSGFCPSCLHGNRLLSWFRAFVVAFSGVAWLLRLRYLDRIDVTLPLLELAGEDDPFLVGRDVDVRLDAAAAGDVV